MFMLVACSTNDDRGPRIDSPPATPSPDASDPWRAAFASGSDEQCLAHGDYDACSDCCYENHPKAKRVIFDTLRVCICTKAAPSCRKECGVSFCDGTATADTASNACFQCLERACEGRDRDCFDTVTSVCTSSMECTIAVRCDDRCFSSRDGGS